MDLQCAGTFPHGLHPAVPTLLFFGSESIFKLKLFKRTGKTSTVLAHLAHGLHPVVGDRDAQGHLIQPDGPGLCHDAAVAEQAEDAAACWACPPDGTDGDQRATYTAAAGSPAGHCSGNQPCM